MTNSVSWSIPLSDVDFGAAEEQAVLRVLHSGWLTMGAETAAFEQEFAEALGVKHAAAVSSGTAALHMALLALDIGPRDAVVQPALNFVAAANMTTAVGATPLFADICSLAEPTICPDSVRRLLADHLPRDTRSPRRSLSAETGHATPKALLVMHYGGYPCRMNELRAICAEYDMLLIEDACHGVGGMCADGEERAHMGTVGDAGCFSFFSNKNLVTGEGGMVTTNRDDIAEKVRLLRSHGMTSLTWDRHRGHAATYDVAARGFNYRIDELRSAMGRVQLAGLDRNNQRRRELTTLYWTELAELEQRGWTLPFRTRFSPSLPHSRTPTLPDFPTPSCHLMTAVAPDAETRWCCAEELKAGGIQTSLHYPLVPGFSAYRDATGRWELAESYAERVLTLPLYPTLPAKGVQTAAAALRRAAGTPVGAGTTP